MRNGSITRWLMAGALGAGLIIGCHNGSRRKVTPRHTPHVPQVSCVNSGMTGCQPMAVPGRCEPGYPREDMSLAYHPQAVPETTIQPPIQTPPAQPEVVSTGYTPQGTIPVKDSYATKRTVIDGTAQPFFQHDDNYTTLCGQLSKYRNRWRLRYLSCDDDDKYGGMFVLDNDSRFDALKEDAFLKVQGRVVSSGDKNNPATFRVATFELLDSAGRPLPGAHLGQ